MSSADKLRGPVLPFQCQWVKQLFPPDSWQPQPSRDLPLGLDASVRGEILELLVRLKDEFGMTLVLITHDLAFAWALADRVAIMYLGKIVELGPVQTVLTEPLHPYTTSLLAVAPEVGRRRTHEVLTGEPPDPAHISPGCRFHPRCPVLRSGEAGSQEPRCLGEVPALEELVPGHQAACHVAAAGD
ncbi:MAG: ABC transporter ATP-binding protein [Rubrobacteraceae bacterium]|nr:ABC transporter ATP-binding protein [Rubrobacteraceae bacterium]